MTKAENALMWLYVKTWGLQGQHVIDKDEMWNFGGTDLQEAIMGIAYPFTKDSENNNRVEGDENLVESLRKLIMGKFENENDEFYKWSRSIHDETMKNIPMKVETRILSFSDSHATANDRVTGESSFVAFRATALKNGFSDQKPVEWANVDYNLGNFFDGTYFTVPKTGLYSFLANFYHVNAYGQIDLYLNDKLKIWTAKGESKGKSGFLTFNTTLQLVKNDKVDIRLQGGVSNLTDPMTTFFE